MTAAEVKSRIDQTRRLLEKTIDSYKQLQAVCPDYQERLRIDWTRGKIIDLRAKLTDLERQLSAPQPPEPGLFEY